MIDDLLVHRIVGSWAIDYKVLMTSAALDEIESRIAAALRAAVEVERERCAKIVRLHPSPGYRPSLYAHARKVK